MQTQFLKLLVIALAINTVSCKKENTVTEYKFEEKGIVLNCDNVNLKLYNEALFSFEKDIEAYYGKGTPNLSRAYSQFIRSAINGRVKYEDVVSKHTRNIFEVLKNETNLWDANNPKTYLNYNSPLVNCIANNIQNKDLKTTLNALISTNSMSPKLFGSPLMTNYSAAVRDKYVAAYVAFDLYYAKLFKVDLSKVTLKKEESKVDFNKVPPKVAPDPHAGHNH